MKSHYLPGILFILLLPISLQAQEAAPVGNQGGQHTIFLEALGSNGFGSLNYEYRFAQEGKWGIAVRGGGYFIPNSIIRLFDEPYYSDRIHKHIAGNLGISVINGIRPHYLEYGIGGGLMSIPYSPIFCYTGPPGYAEWVESIHHVRRHSYLASLRAGYRYQLLEGGFFYTFSIMAMHINHKEGYRYRDGSADWRGQDRFTTPSFSMSIGHTFR